MDRGAPREKPLLPRLDEAGELMTTPAGRVDRYGVALLLIVATTGVLLLSPGGEVASMIAVLLTATTIVFAIDASDVGPRMLLTSRIVAVLAVVVAILIEFDGNAQVIRAGTATVGATLALLVPVPIARRIYRQPRINVHTIAGGLCIYLLAGLAFAYTYAALDVAFGPIFAGLQDAPISQTIYFSFVTLATLGYGDITPASPAARFLAITETIGGQLYLVTIIALLVGNIGRNGTKRD
jgi:hypothetical protein